MKLRFADPWAVPIGLLAAAAVVALVLLAWRSLQKATDRPFRMRLLALRLPAVLLLLLLLFEPMISRDHLRTEDLKVLVLFDRSRSMSIPDSWAGKARHRIASDFLTLPDTGLYPLLSGDFEIVPLSFDTEVRTTKRGELRGVTPPTGRLTDLAGAIESAAKAVPRSEAVAVVLLSDGCENGGGDARLAASALGVPIYAVGFGKQEGAEEGRKDLALLSVDAPETAFAENTVVAEVTLRSSGYDLNDPGNRELRVILEEDNREIGSELVEIDEEEDGVPIRVSLRFVPAGKGGHSYRVRIPLRGDEQVPGNNSRSFSVNVLDRSATVLYFDATMRWEAKFLRDFMARDPAVDLTSVLHSGQGRLLVNGDRHGADLSGGIPATAEGLSRFDVVILGDVDAETLTAAGLARLRDWVEEGGGLLTLGGYRTYGPGGYGASPLAEVLPVVIAEDDDQWDGDIAVSLSPEGRVHPALSGLTAYFTAELTPHLRGLTEVRREKPGALVLLSGEGGGRTEIVMAGQRYGEGRVISFTGDTTWVWYRTPELGGADGLYRRFWGQLLRWLLEEDPEVAQAGEPLILFTDRPGYRIGEMVRVRARLRGEEGEPLSDATLSVTLAGPKGESRLELQPLVRVPGVYEARLRPVEPGDYQLTGHATRGSITLGPATAKYTVADESVEMDVVDLDDVLLNEVARVSGGRFYLGSPTAEQVAADIRSSLVGLVEHEEIALSDAPLFFLLFVGLLTAEWILRRRRNLL